MNRIQSIAECRYGLSLLPRNYNDAGEIWVIDATSVIAGDIIKNQPEKRVLMEKRFKRHLLKNGDILLRGRASKNFSAAVFESEATTPAVCTASVIVLRLKTARIQPAFLAWALNQSPIQTALKNAQQGGTIQSISTKALGQIYIPAPAHETQTRALQLNKLTARYQKIVARHCEIMKRLTLEKIWKT